MERNDLKPKKIPEANIKRATKYIKAKASGLSKIDAMRLAGYSESTARVPQLLESREAYQVALERMTSKNMLNIQTIADRVADDIASDKFIDSRLSDKVDIMRELVDMQVKLSPVAKMVQSTDKDGNTTTSKWITTHAQPLVNNTDVEQSQDNN